jgi:hypothetical protein
LRHGGSHPYFGKGSDLVLSLRTRGIGKVPCICTNLEFGAVLECRVMVILVCLLVPLPDDNTVKKEVIHSVVSGLVGG